MGRSCFGRLVFLVALSLMTGCHRSSLPSLSTGNRPQAYQPAPQRPPVIVQPPAVVQNPWKPDKPAREWRHIVIHHTASSRDSVDSIHQAHLKRGWEGVGYHFVIGNGSGMGDGEIEPTFRWKTQMHGAHAGADEYNQHGIGICLVGNFEESHPSKSQLTAVKKLVGVLKQEYGIKSDRVIGHKTVKSTACPGKHFPLVEVSQSEFMPFLSAAPRTPMELLASAEWRRLQ